MTLIEKDKAKKLTEELIGQMNCYLVDFHVKLYNKRTFIKAVAETESGITLEQITQITKELKNSDDFNELFPLGYRLEVTSPGTDYRLKTERDFRRYLGHIVKIFHKIENLKSPLSGGLVEVNEKCITLSLAKDKVQIFRICDIDYGKAVLKW